MFEEVFEPLRVLSSKQRVLTHLHTAHQKSE